MILAHEVTTLMGHTIHSFEAKTCPSRLKLSTWIDTFIVLYNYTKLRVYLSPGFTYPDNPSVMEAKCIPAVSRWITTTEFYEILQPCRVPMLQKDTSMFPTEGLALKRYFLFYYLIQLYNLTREGRVCAD